MDEWGTSIWETPSDPTPAIPSLAKLDHPTYPAAEPPPVPSYDFDDLSPASQSAPDDDDFGEFGDSQEGGQGLSFDDGDSGVFREVDRIPVERAPTSAIWEPLRLHPLPPPIELAQHVQEILAPIWARVSPEEIMTSEDIRQVEGLGQVLVTADSRALYKTLFNVSPAVVTRPPNWTRSRIRRQHLISLGIPINLDEVMPHANGKPLPVLKITTRPSSAPPGPRPAPHSNPASGTNTRAGTPNPGTPQSTGRNAQTSLGLGPKPKLNDSKISEMLGLNPDTLPFLPLPTLEAHLNTLRTLTSDTSSLLSHLLQTREALQQDSETYNGLIAELVGEAQKMKTGGKSRTGAGKRGSGI